MKRAVLFAALGLGACKQAAPPAAPQMSTSGSAGARGAQGGGTTGGGFAGSMGGSPTAGGDQGAGGGTSQGTMGAGGGAGMGGAGAGMGGAGGGTTAPANGAALGSEFQDPRDLRTPDDKAQCAKEFEWYAPTYQKVNFTSDNNFQPFCFRVRGVGDKRDPAESIRITMSNYKFRPDDANEKPVGYDLDIVWDSDDKGKARPQIGRQYTGADLEKFTITYMKAGESNLIYAVPDTSSVKYYELPAKNGDYFDVEFSVDLAEHLNNGEPPVTFGPVTAHIAGRVRSRYITMD